MGGSSKEQTVGYKIYLGLQAVLTHGPVDKLLRLRWDERDAWTGVSTGGPITINKPGLFGDEEREGGIVGTVDFEQGGPTQGRNSYLQSQMGTEIPAFRGVTQLVMRALYWGMNPYLKSFSALLQRIHVRQDGIEQWYDAKAEVVPAVGAILGEPWLYKVLPYHSNPGYEQLTPPTEWDGEETLPFTSSKVWLWPTPPGWPTPDLSVIWIKKVIPNVPAGMVIQLRAENGCVLWINGELIGASNRDNEDISSNQNNPVNFTVPQTGTYEIIGKAFTESTTATQGGNVLSITLDAVPGGLDMNPAHIIREALTDPDWGMGYNESDIDDDSFMAAADKLYNESFGLSLLWDKQMPIEDFIKEVLRHIGAALFVSRTTGKFKLRLIRGDYNVEDLPVLGPGQIESVDGHTFQAAGEFVNSITVNYDDHLTGDASVTESDSALVQMQGAVVNTTVSYPGIANADLAGRVVLRDLLTLSTPLHSCNGYLPQPTAKDFEIGDVFVMNWPEHKIANVVMRIMGMKLGDGKKNHFRLVLSQDIYSLPDAGSVTAPAPDWTDPVTPPEALTTRLAIEAPYIELIQRADQTSVDTRLENTPEIGYVLTTAQREGSAVNADLWTDSGSGYAQAAVVDFSPVLTLNTDTGYGDTVWDVADTKDADLIEVGMYGQIGNEFVVIAAKDGASLTVGRGCVDTVPEPHLAGSKLIVFDAYGGIDEREYLDGESVNVKLLPSAGGGKLDISEAPVDSVTMNQRAIRPYPPGNVKINSVAYPTGSISDEFTVTWSHRNRQAQADVIVDTAAGDVTPADNIRYGLRFLDSLGALIIERQDIGPGTADVTLNYTGLVTMELYTIDNTAESWQQHSFTFDYSGTGPNAIVATAYTPVDDSTIIDGGEI